MVWGYKVKVMLGGFAALAKSTGTTVSGLCGETRSGSKSNQFDIGETGGATTAKFKTRGYFSKRLIQNLGIWKAW